jgi:hypothetical protein
VSIRAIGAVLALGPEVAGGRRLVLIALADNMNDEGWAYPKRRTIAAKAGLKRLETVTELLGSLEADGYIERDVNGWAGIKGDIPKDQRPNLYRFTDKITGAPRNPGIGGSPDGGEGGLPGIRGPESFDPSVIVEPDNNPLPPGRGEQGSLLDASNEETPVRERRKRATENPMVSASFDEWWTRYPSGKKGDRGAALRAFSKAIATDSIATLDRQLANYVAARQLYAGHFGGWAAPLRHASSWLNQARESYSEPWTLEDCRYWPPPPGKSWDAVSPRGETREELMARELAREAREAEERALAMAEFEDEDDEEWI